MWIAGSWNFTGLREAKVDFAAAPVPRLFKQPVVWSMPHQFTFPKPKAADAAQARGGVDAHPLDDRPRGGVDAQGRPGLGRRGRPTADPRITADPGAADAAHAQAPNWQVGQSTPKWVATET